MGWPFDQILSQQVCLVPQAVSASSLFLMRSVPFLGCSTGSRFGSLKCNEVFGDDGFTHC